MMSAKRGCQVVGKRSKENNISKSRSAELIWLLIGISFIRYKGEDNNQKPVVFSFISITYLSFTNCYYDYWCKTQAVAS